MLDGKEKIFALFSIPTSEKQLPRVSLKRIDNNKRSLAISIESCERPIESFIPSSEDGELSLESQKSAYSEDDQSTIPITKCIESEYTIVKK